MSLSNTIDTAQPRPAAAVILLRGEVEPDVLLVQRGPGLRFMPGHHVFPGGRVDDADHEVPIRNAPSAEDRAFVVAAARECFEEAGILLAEGGVPDGALLDGYRRALLAGETDFSTILSALKLTLDGARFIPAGRWVTPSISPIRFDTRFYLYRCTGNLVASAIPEDGEITAAEWVSPGVAREEWHRNTRKLSAPVAYALQQLAALPHDDALPGLNAVPADEHGVATAFEFRRGILMVPLRSPTIAPATHTNTLLIGEEEFIVVDPGTEDAEEQARLLNRVAQMEALGGRLIAILLTHSHVDHVAGLPWLLERREVPVWAHEITADRIDVPVARHLADGERITLAGSPGWELECLHTPGHDPGHLALLDHSTQTLMAADLVANPGTIVVSPEWEGDMTDYLESLERCSTLDFTLLIPGHGFPTFGRAGQKVFVNIIAHRLEREARIARALKAGADSMIKLIEMAYADVGKESWPLAMHQAQAHLKRLGVELD